MIDFEPYDYQHTVIDHIESKKRSACFVDMGMGKTVCSLQAITNMQIFDNVRSTLIISPVRVTRLTWPMEAEKWSFCSHLKVVSLRDVFLTRKKDQRKREAAIKAWQTGDANIFLLNYEYIQRFFKEYVINKPHIAPNQVIFDESHKLKNPASKRGRMFNKCASYFDYRTILTGTPIGNGYRDIFAQIRLLDGGKALDHRITYFLNKYFYRPNPNNPYKWCLKDGAKEDIESRISHLSLTMKSEDYLDLPSVEVIDREIKLPPKVFTQYKKLEREFLLDLPDGEVEALSAATLTMKLLQLSSGEVYDENRKVLGVHDSKITELDKLIKESPNETFLVACAYKHEQERICQHIEGAQMFAEKDIRKWNEKKIKCWVADYRAIAEGLNLQYGTRNIVWYTQTYDAVAYTQFNKRVARIGQTERARIFRLICQDTADEAVIEALRHKDNEQKGMFTTLSILERMRKAA